MGRRLAAMDREVHFAEIRHAYEEGGMTVRELAFLYDVGYGTMHDRLSKAGVTMRPRSDQPPIGAPKVNPVTVPCTKCGVPAYIWCRNTFRQKINHFHVARKRAAAEVDIGE